MSKQTSSDSPPTKGLSSCTPSPLRNRPPSRCTSSTTCCTASGTTNPTVGSASDITCSTHSGSSQSKSSGSHSDVPSRVMNRSTPLKSASWRAERQRWLPTGQLISGSARPGQRRSSASEPDADQHDHAGDHHQSPHWTPHRARHLGTRVTAELTCRSTSRTSIRGSWFETNMAPRSRSLAV
jgi:hypothetical protein